MCGRTTELRLRPAAEGTPSLRAAITSSQLPMVQSASVNSARTAVKAGSVRPETRRVRMTSPVSTIDSAVRVCATARLVREATAAPASAPLE